MLDRPPVEKVIRYWPKPDWEDIYFNHHMGSEIRKREEMHRMIPLTMTALVDDEFEIRYWASAFECPACGSVFARRSGEWQVCALLPFGDVVQIPEPRDGWEVFWQGLQDAGLLTMEDPNPGRVGIGSNLHGCSFIVEANTGGRYKSFHFAADSEESPLRNQMGRIAYLMHILLKSGIGSRVILGAPRAPMSKEEFFEFAP